MFSDALGQEGQEIVNFKVISNTDDFPGNNTEEFYNQPYKGVEFDRRFPWNIRLLSASIPFNVDTNLEKDIWFKRLQIPTSKHYSDHYNNCFTGSTYNNFLSRCERICFPESDAYSLITGNTSSPTIPDKLINFFNSIYQNKVRLAPGIGQGIREFWNVYPLLKIEKTPSLTEEANDIFEFNIYRTENNNKRVPPKKRSKRQNRRK